MMKEDTVYPGCTRADKTITSLLCWLPTVSKGISRPLNDLANTDGVATVLICEIRA